MISADALCRQRADNFFFNGLLLYTIIYYSQLGSRIPFLGAIRIEMVIGTTILIPALFRFFKDITHNEEEKSILYPVYFFFAASLISIPTTVAGYHTISALINLCKSFAIFIMINAAIRSEKQLRIFVYVFLAMHAFIIVEPFILSSYGSVLRSRSFGSIRLGAVTGLFAHPNALGALSTGILPVIYFLFRYERSILVRLMIVALSLVTLKVITLTESRTALVATLGFIFYLWITSRKKLVFAVLVVIALPIAWSCLDPMTKDRYLSLLDADEVILGREIRDETGEAVSRGSMQKRYQIVKDGLTLFLQRPITGFGIGGYQIARIERLGRYQVAHNAYVQCLSEVGIFGFIPWSLILINTFGLLSKPRRILAQHSTVDGYRFINEMSYAFQGYLVVHLLVAMFGHNPYGNYWWIPAAVSLVLIKLLKRRIT